MANEHEPFDESFEVPDEAQLTWLMTSAHAAPEMRSEFSSRLHERLDAEFAATRGARVVGGAVNGHVPADGVLAAMPRREDVSDGDDGAAYVIAAAAMARRERRARRRRTVLSVAAAAAILFAMSIWFGPPAWANVLRTIVHNIAELTFGPADERNEPGEVDVERPPAEVVVVEEAPAAEAVAKGEVKLRIAKPPVAAEQHEDLVERKTELEKEDKAAAKAAHEKFVPAAETIAWQPFDAPLPENELARQVDEQLTALWQKNGIEPAGQASDPEFMRRAYLDLTGRIPTVSEVRTFLDDKSPERRKLLVDRLLAHHDHTTHLAAVWREVLLPNDVDLTRLGGTAKFDEWLAGRFRENVSYDKIVRELLLAEGRVSESGPLLFYAALKLNPEELAARTSRAFLGVRMECAQCHDHPFDAVSQNDFWSFAAFFARISRPRGKMEMTSPVLAVRDNAEGDVTIPDTDEVVRPRLPLSAIELEEKSNSPPRREQLVDWLASPNNGQFARATVNRVWAHLFGRGLVEPVDDMRPDNAPIAPEVLDTLSRDFAASGFDMRRLLRELVLTNAYQLSSRSEVSDPGRTLHFAQMNIKSFTAEQLYDCISVAAGRSVAGAVNAPGLDRFSNMSRQAFIEQFRAPTGQMTDYQAGIPQALTLMHGGLIHSATDLGSSGLLKSLAAPFFSDDQRLDTLFLATLSRYPEDRER
jgi:hypothetical protein